MKARSAALLLVIKREPAGHHVRKYEVSTDFHLSEYVRNYLVFTMSVNSIEDIEHI